MRCLRDDEFLKLSHTIFNVMSGLNVNQLRLERYAVTMNNASNGIFIV